MLASANMRIALFRCTSLSPCVRSAGERAALSAMEETAQSAAEALRAEALRTYGAQVVLTQMQAASETIDSSYQWAMPDHDRSEFEALHNLETARRLCVVSAAHGRDGADANLSSPNESPSTVPRSKVVG